jgi:hypothetical protein
VEVEKKLEEVEEVEEEEETQQVGGKMIVNFFCS